MLNSQPIEKRDNGDGGTHLYVNSIFQTIQGEGPFVGEPAVFIRLAGCNLQCPMCDTEYTQRSNLSIANIMEGVLVTPQTRLVVITGGEPFRQTLLPLVKTLLDHNYTVQIETNGTLFQELPYWHEDLVIVCSPKTGKINNQLMPHIHSLKYVARAGRLSPIDGLPLVALEHPNSPALARPPEEWNGEIYLQPEDEQDERRNFQNTNAVIESCLTYNHRLCIQTHKIIGVP